MQPHQDLATALAPHLESLSTASAALLTPLTAVLTTLISEMVSLRASHDQLVTRISRIDAHISTVLPHSIPSPPRTPSPTSPPVDPELTQPPSPLPPHSADQEPAGPSASPHSQDDTPHIENHETQSVKPERLKRRRRSSKRPCSAHSTPRVKQENFEGQPQRLSSQDQPAGKLERHSPATSSPMRTPSSSLDTGNATHQHHTPTNHSKALRKLLKECDHNVCVLPTTPTTELKSQKRKLQVFSYEPVLEGYASAADAAREVDKIAARRAAENCPPAFRPGHKQPSSNTCLQCQESRKALAAEAPDPDVTFQRLMQIGCRHKEQVPRPATPEGYWALDFAETPTQPP